MIDAPRPPMNGLINAPASAWVQRWSHLVKPGARVLDVACGSGRHAHWFAGRGCRVTGVDRDATAMRTLPANAEHICADIEGGPWPLAGRSFDAVIVTNYLWRALLPTLVASLAEGGVLIYETFAVGHETVGKPTNPKFLLQHGELLHAVRGLRLVAYEDGVLETPERFVQRVVVVRESALAPLPTRYPLSAPTAPRGQVKSTDSEEPE